MKISRLQGETAEVAIKFPPPKDDPDAGEEEIKVVYRPGALTLEVADRIRELDETGFEMNIMLELFKRMLVSWDLQDNEGNQLGVSEEEIKIVPLAFLGRLLGAMEEDVRPNPRKDATSEEASQEGQRVPSLAGTSLSEQPSTTE